MNQDMLSRYEMALFQERLAIRARLLRTTGDDAGRLQALADRIEAALGRIDRREFGRCAKCGKLIPSQRLALVPYAEYCIDCQKSMERRTAYGAAPQALCWSPFKMSRRPVMAPGY